MLTGSRSKDIDTGISCYVIVMKEIDSQVESADGRQALLLDHQCYTKCPSARQVGGDERARIKDLLHQHIL